MRVDSDDLDSLRGILEIKMPSSSLEMPKIDSPIRKSLMPVPDVVLEEEEAAENDDDE